MTKIGFFQWSQPWCSPTPLFMRLLPFFSALAAPLLLTFASDPAPAQAQTAEGYVYHDRNGDEKRDPGEQGISEIAVSNGEQVTLTDENGYWELPAEAGDIFFVVKPSDWMTPVNRSNLPRFYYVHQPDGSPDDLKYRGVDPTGPLPEEINFPLYPETTGSQFTALLFGDTQPYTIQEVDYVARDVVHELIDVEGVEFGMTLGDIVGDSLALFQPLNEAIAEVGIPWYNVLGNHDVNYDVPRDYLSSETFKRVYGPPTYAFQYGESHFIVLDDVIYPSEPRGDSYVGGLRPDQLRFVENYLEHVPENELVVLAMHIPLAQHGESFRQSDQAKLFELLRDHSHTLSISAHTHKQEHKFFEEETSAWSQPEPHHHFNAGTTSGSWWNGLKSERDIPHTMMRDGTPNGYAFVHFDGPRYEIDWKAAGRPADDRMNIHTPEAISAGTAEEPLLTVNVFNASERAEVEYRLRESAPWTPMKKVEKFDPYYVDLYKREQNLDTLMTAYRENHPEREPGVLPNPGLPSPDTSSHLWEAPLGTDRAPGRHRVEVRVTDMFGRTYSAFHTFRVVE